MQVTWMASKCGVAAIPLALLSPFGNTQLRGGGFLIPNNKPLIQRAHRALDQG
jgi:hypothetical protein